MRINVYSQELILDNYPRAVKVVEQLSDTGVTYTGARLYLHSPEQLHDRPDDDDRSAITFWLPKSRDNREVMANLFAGLATIVLNAKPETGLD